MKTRPLGSPPRSGFATSGVSSPAPPPPKMPPSTLLAAVDKRRPDGTVTKLILPARTAGSIVPYMIPTADGRFITAGSVDAAGVVRPAGLGQPDPKPSTPLRCVLSSAGEILLVQEAPRRTRRK